MPDLFDRHFQKRSFPSGNLTLMREAYDSAVQTLGFEEDGSDEDRVALIDIIQKIANVEPFRKSEHMAALAVEWYKSLKR